jgi:hypothetical protein
MDVNSKDCLKQLDTLLAERNQSWLFGAGISFRPGIPLMKALTERVFNLAKEKGEPNDNIVLEYIRGQLPEQSHIEHVLSHIGDHRAIAERSRDKQVKFRETVFSLEELDAFHKRILLWISETIRWGYKSKTDHSPEQIGNREMPIVKIDDHRNFISVLFNRGQAGLVERRGAVRLFTTNYDTLLEDALALNHLPYWDGFNGGAVAYRSYRYGDKEPDHGYRAHVIKLHGSIDWHLGEDGKVWRVRDGDTYPETTVRVLIYPQSIKYLATQRDPFAAQFDIFRRTLSANEENVLGICGYSFGDDHINQEIELSLSCSGNRTTILVFAQSLNDTLESWRQSAWGKRLYIISQDGLYIGKDDLLCAPPSKTKHDWWTFQGMTKLLINGAEAYIE